MVQALANRGHTLLSPADHTLILIDFQSQMAFATKSADGVSGAIVLIAGTSVQTNGRSPIRGICRSVLSAHSQRDELTNNGEMKCQPQRLPPAARYSIRPITH
jgi:hypothetical protein